MKIGIAGAGLLGRLLAFQLDRAGHDVHVFDPAPHAEARGAAGWTAAGMLSPVAELECADENVFRLGLRTITLWPQLLAQLDSPESVQSIKDMDIGALDLAKFQAAMETLHQLDGSAGPLGDPKEAIDTHQDAATKAQALFDADPPTQADIDAYNESIGEPGKFLMHQAPISGALEEAGC